MPTIAPEVVFRWFRPRTIGDPASGLVPAAGWIAAWYSAGTSNPKAVYDADGTVYPSPSNEVTLDSEGKADIRLGTGNYKLQILDTDRAVIYTQDDIAGGGSFGTGFCDVVVDETGLGGLKDVDCSVNRFTFCAGYWAIGDGGHGMFWNETSTDAEDGGYIIASQNPPEKRLFRIPDESGDVRAASFGYIGSNNEDYNAEFVAAASYASANNHRLIVGAGNLATVGVNGQNLIIYAPAIHFEPGAVLTANTGVLALGFYAIVTGQREWHFVGFTAVTFPIVQTLENPEWFNVTPGVVNDAGFTAWLASLPAGGAFILPPGEWAWSLKSSFPYPSNPLLMNGSVVCTTGGTIPTGYYGTDDSQLRMFSLLFKNDVSLTSSTAGLILLSGSLTSSATLTGIDVLGTTSVKSNSHVTAGNVGAGQMLARAGTSTKFIASSGQYAVNQDPVTTTNATVQNLMSLAMAANTIKTIGDRIRIRASFSAVGTSSAKNIAVYFVGAVTVPLFTTPAGTVVITGGTIDLTIDVWALSSSYQSTGKITFTDYGAGNYFTLADFEGGSAIDFSGAFTIQTKCQVTSGSGSNYVTQNILAFEYIPVSP